MPLQVPIDFSRIFQTGCRDSQHLWTMCILFIEIKSTGKPISVKYHSIYCNNCDLLYKLGVQIRSCGSHQRCLPNISSFLPSGDMVGLHFLALWHWDGTVWHDLANVCEQRAYVISKPKHLASGPRPYTALIPFGMVDWWMVEMVASLSAWVPEGLEGAESPTDPKLLYSTWEKGIFVVLSHWDLGLFL